MGQCCGLAGQAPHKVLMVDEDVWAELRVIEHVWASGTSSLGGCCSSQSGSLHSADLIFMEFSYPSSKFPWLHNPAHAAPALPHSRGHGTKDGARQPPSCFWGYPAMGTQPPLLNQLHGTSSGCTRTIPVATKPCDNLGEHLWRPLVSPPWGHNPKGHRAPMQFG